MKFLIFLCFVVATVSDDNPTEDSVKLHVEISAIRTLKEGLLCKTKDGKGFRACDQVTTESKRPADWHCKVHVCLNYTTFERRICTTEGWIIGNDNENNMDWHKSRHPTTIMPVIHKTLSLPLGNVAVLTECFDRHAASVCATDKKPESKEAEDVIGWFNPLIVPASKRTDHYPHHMTHSEEPLRRGVDTTVAMISYKWGLFCVKDACRRSHHTGPSKLCVLCRKAAHWAMAGLTKQQTQPRLAGACRLIPSAIGSEICGKLLGALFSHINTAEHHRTDPGRACEKIKICHASRRKRHHHTADRDDFLEEIKKIF